MTTLRARPFALVFGTIMVALAVFLVVFAEKAIRSRSAWVMDAHVARTDAGWAIELRPSVPAYVYAVAERPDGSLDLLLAGPTSGMTEAIPAQETFRDTIGLESDSILLLLADPRPLWSIEEARAKAKRRRPEGPWRLDLDAVLEVRGLAALPAGSGSRVSQVVAQGSDGEAEIRGLWARRWS